MKDTLSTMKLLVVASFISAALAQNPNLNIKCNSQKCLFDLKIAQNYITPINTASFNSSLSGVESSAAADNSSISVLAGQVSSLLATVTQNTTVTASQLATAEIELELLDREIAAGQSQINSLINDAATIQQELQCIQNPSNCHIIPAAQRVDCHPDPGVSQASCAARGCTYDGLLNLPFQGAPRCYYPPGTGYKFASQSGNTYTLSKAGTASPFSTDLSQIQLTSSGKANGTLRVKITDTQNLRYQVPVPLPNHNYPYKCGGPPGNHFDCDTLTFTQVHGTQNTFAFQIVRQSTQRVLFDTSLGGLIFADQFIQIASYLPSRNVYGFGENIHQSLRHDLSQSKTWPMFARDEAPDSFSEDRKNLYGVHPFYMVVEPDGKAHGVLIFNSNAQEYTLGPGPGATQGLLTYRTIGGILDLYFFPGPTPGQVIQQYTALIGYPALPAYWAFGFQLSRWGYGNLATVEAVINRTRNAGIPQETQVFDIDYMDHKKDFTYDHTNFSDITGFVQRTIHANNMKLIVILDPAIDVYSFNYTTFKQGYDDRIYITWANQSYVQNCQSTTNPYYNCPLNNLYPTTNSSYGQSIMLGTVWPDHNTAFPNWFNPNSTTWWINQIMGFNSTVPFDGLWIDMNEPANFATNNQDAWYCQPSAQDQHHPCIKMLFCPDNNKYEQPPYKTWAVYHYQYSNNPNPRLANKTLCMNANQGQYKHYDVHSLYGWGEAKATQQALRMVHSDRRGSVISRSTFVGSGAYTGHWLGDNTARFADLKTSIIGIQEFTMFGMPHVGADICGFFGNSYPELCLRWQQAGAFYPFFRLISRNHNSFGNKAQDPAVFGQAVINATRKAAMFRYHYLPYLHTLFHHAQESGITPVRPLFFEFPTDPIALGVSFQFLWGSGFLVTPVLEENVTTVRGYFPNAIWYSIYDFNYAMQVTNPGSWQTLQAPTTTMIPVHVRGGIIIPRQQGALRTQLARQNPMELLVAPDSGGQAIGDLMWDDGETIVLNNTAGHENYYYFKFHYWGNSTGGTLKLRMFYNASNTGVPITTLDIIEIFNYPAAPNHTSFTLDGKNLGLTASQVQYSASKKQLLIQKPGMIHMNQLMMHFPASKLSWSN